MTGHMTAQQQLHSNINIAKNLTSSVLNKELSLEYVNRSAFLSKPDFACSSYKNARGVLLSTCFASRKYDFKYSTAYVKVIIGIC